MEKMSKYGQNITLPPALNEPKAENSSHGVMQNENLLRLVKQSVNAASFYSERSGKSFKTEFLLKTTPLRSLLKTLNVS
jgi:hypothetical protein